MLRIRQSPQTYAPLSRPSAFDCQLTIKGYGPDREQAFMDPHLSRRSALLGKVTMNSCATRQTSNPPAGARACDFFSYKFITRKHNPFYLLMSVVARGMKFIKVFPRTPHKGYTCTNSLAHAFCGWEEGAYFRSQYLTRLQYRFCTSFLAAKTHFSLLG